VLFPNILSANSRAEAESGHCPYWRWRSRPRGGRPATPEDIRRLIRDSLTVGGRKKFQGATFCKLGHFKIQIRTEASELGHHLAQPAPPDIPRASKLSGCEPSGVSSHFVQAAQIMAAAASTAKMRANRYAPTPSATQIASKASRLSRRTHSGSNYDQLLRHAAVY
jgi:hypothetical protein